MADARVYSAGVQIVRRHLNPPTRVYSAGVQVVRLLNSAPPPTVDRRRNFMSFNP